jgi:hypothetical protein
MSFNTKNYHAHGGDEWVIGGKLTFLPGATVEGGEGLFDGGEGAAYTLPAATSSTLGGIKVGAGLSITQEGVLSADGITPAAYQADSEATTIAQLKESFNTLLAALRTAGLMAAQAAETPAEPGGGGT